ncbi:MAG: metallopeptidase (SprT family) [Halieaceae bacterium]|jgi:SprT protein|nr:metallopeptidase (SprT family) [Halieaceae bacterium]
MIAPIGKQQQQRVRQETAFFVQRARELYGRKFSNVDVDFDLCGTTAGMYKIVGHRRRIRYNPWIFAKYFEENLSGTVPHEVAHFIVDELYHRGSIKPHGEEWQEVMLQFNADPGVTFNLDLSGIPRRRQRTHRYRCHCRVHHVSSTRHNRVARGTGSYNCCACNSKLLYVG